MFEAERYRCVPRRPSSDAQSFAKLADLLSIACESTCLAVTGSITNAFALLDFV
jgi:hypothetical protein